MSSQSTSPSQSLSRVSKQFSSAPGYDSAEPSWRHRSSANPSGGTGGEGLVLCPVPVAVQVEVVGGQAQAVVDVAIAVIVDGIAQRPRRARRLRSSQSSTVHVALDGMPDSIGIAGSPCPSPSASMYQVDMPQRPHRR